MMTARSARVGPVAVAFFSALAATPGRAGGDPRTTLTRHTDIPRHSSTRTRVAQPTDAPRCVAINRGGYHTIRALHCPRYVSSQVEQWDPQVLVPLGGGILDNGDPGCPNVQRAWIAFEMFERLGRRPLIVLSGGQPRGAGFELTPAARRCAIARRTQDLARSTGDVARRRLERGIVWASQARRASLTESEYMCATILGAYPESEWDSVLSHMVFEARSSSTVQNAAFTTPTLVSGGFERVLVISTPTYRPGNVVENHAHRAAVTFRRRRPRDAHYRVAAIACPFAPRGPSWSEWE